MVPVDFEFLINSIRPKTARKGNTYKAAVPVQDRLTAVLVQRVLAMADFYTSL
jgi:hypothetical protein